MKKAVTDVGTLKYQFTQAWINVLPRFYYLHKLMKNNQFLFQSRCKQSLWHVPSIVIMTICVRSRNDSGPGRGALHANSVECSPVMFCD